MAIAVRIARAHTGRDKVAFCGYHGWHDWYLAANIDTEEALGEHLISGLDPAGVPYGLKGTAVPFNYNDSKTLMEIAHRNGEKLAAVVLEPIRNQKPAPGFFDTVRQVTEDCKAVLVVDEISAGFRMNTGGAHMELGLEPDIAVFSKALSNGYPMAAVIGKEDTMAAAQDTFISSAFWTEAVGPAAAVATVRKMMRIDVPAHVGQIGQQAWDGITALATTHGLPLRFTGYPAFTTFAFDHPKALALQTLWTARMLRHGFLASAQFYPTLAHQPHHVEAYLAACDEVFAEMGDAIRSDDIEDRIGGPVKYAGFTRLA